MLSWKIDKNVITELYYKGQNIINPWGFETADSSAFFSLEEGIGHRYHVVNEQYNFDDMNYQATVNCCMKEGHWALNINDSIVNGQSIERSVEAITLEDSIFMDFVMRFRFKKDEIQYALIDNKKIYHHNTNVYYQFPVRKVFLKGHTFDINIIILDCIVPDKMEPVMYVRDHGDEWVVHARMIPKEWDKEVIKICTNWAETRPLPQLLTNMLLKSDILRNSMWYRGERDPYKNKIFRRLVNPMAFGMVRVPKGQKLMWKVKFEIK